MATSVKDFKDILELAIVSNDTTPAKGRIMSGMRKKTPEQLDKMICTIWNYQQQHNGETPSASFVARNSDVNLQSTSWFINILVDQGRINKISGRPFRATINMEHPDNKRAIAAFKRLTAKREQFEENERQLIRERQEREAGEGQLQMDKAAVSDFHADVTSTLRQNAASPALTAAFATRMRPDVDAANEAVLERAVTNAQTARNALRDNNRVIKAAMPQLVKLAETRDLLSELLERGYAVSRK